MDGGRVDRTLRDSECSHHCQTFWTCFFSPSFCSLHPARSLAWSSVYDTKIADKHKHKSTFSVHFAASTTPLCMPTVARPLVTKAPVRINGFFKNLIESANYLHRMRRSAHFPIHTRTEAVSCYFFYISSKFTQHRMITHSLHRSKVSKEKCFRLGPI